MTEPVTDRPILTAGPPRCPECPPRTILRPSFEGAEIEVDGVKYHAVGWSGSQMEYHEGPALRPPPRPGARPGDDSIANWIS